MRGQHFFEGMAPTPEKPREPMTKDVYNPYSEEHRSRGETVRRVTAVGARGGKRAQGPAGMRGSIPERLGVSHRLDRKAAGVGRWQSLRGRMEDEDREDDYDEPPERHPKTGLPEWGSVSTHGYPGFTTPANRAEDPAIGFEHGTIPTSVSYHGSAPTARRQAGTPKWIPVPGLATGQPSVSAGRVHEAMERPETTSSPRFPASHKELPHVYETTGQKAGERTYTMIDGNHRASANILQGKMFMEANVLTEHDIPKVKAITDKISRAKTRASQNERVDADAVEERMNRNVYGTGY